MKVSYKWLNERFFGGRLAAAEKIAQTLTMRAFEVESLARVEDDFVLDAKVLPNRSHDALSHKGIAHEISHLTGTKILYKPERATGDSVAKTHERISLSIESGAKCNRAVKKVVYRVRVGESPDWLKKYLTAIGQKTINNIVDCANFVMFETGQPVHTFDLDKIAGDGRKNVYVKNAKAGETVKCLDEKTYTLEAETLVIADEKKALDIAGIKGGMESGITEKTKNILISACNFDPVSIRNTSKRLGLRSDASVRFEGGLSPEIIPNAVELLAALIEKTAGGKATSDILDIYPKPRKKSFIEISLSEINKLLGIKMTASAVSKILASAEFGWRIEAGAEKKFIVEIPPERLDLDLKEALIEEIARLSGYENIGARKPKNAGGLFSFAKSRAKVDKNLFYQEKIRNILLDAGFSEVYTYTFRDKGEVELANPIASDKSFLRESLQEGIEEALKQNIVNADLISTDKIMIFEIGSVFGQSGEKLSLMLSMRGRESAKGANLEAELKEVVEILKARLHNAVSSLATGASEMKVRFLSGQHFYIAEIGLEELVGSLTQPENFEHGAKKPTESPQYKKISPYPFIARDIAVFVPKNVSSEKILKKIVSASGKLLVNYRLFDVFQKKFSDGSEKISYAFRLVFQSQERTLTDAEVNKIMEKISGAFGKGEGWQVR